MRTNFSNKTISYIFIYIATDDKNDISLNFKTTKILFIVVTNVDALYFFRVQKTHEFHKNPKFICFKTILV